VEGRNKACLTIGRPGTGKTVFLSQVVERLAERKAKGVIYDFKGDYVLGFMIPNGTLFSIHSINVAGVGTSLMI